MLVYFATISALGIASIAADPRGDLGALAALGAYAMSEADPRQRGFIAMGTAVLAVTGAEALYADMGQFGRAPIRVSWLVFVLPALVLNDLGQAAALLLRQPGNLRATASFNLLRRRAGEWPLLIIATMAAVIAAKAVISGAFLVTQQAIQLGFIPRMMIRHTSTSAGQIYIPTINWALMIAVILLVLVFERSQTLTAAYGIAVMGDADRQPAARGGAVQSVALEAGLRAAAARAVLRGRCAIYLGANLANTPMAAGCRCSWALPSSPCSTTWSRGRALMRQHMAEGALPLEVFTRSAHTSAARVPGTAVFMASTAAGVPLGAAPQHQAQQGAPRARRGAHRPDRRRAGSRGGRARGGQGHGAGLLPPDPALRLHRGDRRPGCALRRLGLRRTVRHDAHQLLPLAPDPHPGRRAWHGPVARTLFAWMLRNAADAMGFFRLPTNRVVELGSQLRI